MRKELLKTALISTLVISTLLAGCGAREATTSPALAKTHTYLGSSSSDKYHYPSCTAAKKIKEANQVWFSNVSEAKSAGYVPCKVCKPPNS
ncbi:Ada metal-binding domain-containing protein [Desulfosporosinus sp.]|uniref:Ada metal-binding domain-containing protein n=1 Tax=Desulfosporosinus sp. TaxID=157907 RepID=UPI0026176E51|nr:Ada metal-binding domain-containing protein [Desulfosporosinus sp.]MCO5384650.1 hypothetical protein [Desulfosporosinus sp.]